MEKTIHLLYGWMLQPPRRSIAALEHACFTPLPPPQPRPHPCNTHCPNNTDFVIGVPNARTSRDTPTIYLVTPQQSIHLPRPSIHEIECSARIAAGDLSYFSSETKESQQPFTVEITPRPRDHGSDLKHHLSPYNLVATTSSQ